MKLWPFYLFGAGYLFVLTPNSKSSCGYGSFHPGTLCEHQNRWIYGCSFPQNMVILCNINVTCRFWRILMSVGGMVSIWLLSITITVLLLWWLWWVPLSFLCWWWGEVRFMIHQMEKNKKKTNSGSKLYFVSSRNPRLQRPGTTWATESLQARHHPAQSSPWKEITMTRHDSHVQPWIILSQPHLALATIQIQVKLPANLLDSWTFCSISTCPHILQSPSTSSFTHHVLISHIYQVSIVIVVSPTTRNKGGSLKPPSPNRFQAPTELLPRLLEAPPEALLRCDSVESRCSRDSRDTAMLEMARRRSSTSERRRRRDKGFLWLHRFWMVLDGFGTLEVGGRVFGNLGSWTIDDDVMYRDVIIWDGIRF